MWYRISAFTLLIFLAGTFYLSAQENYEVRKLTFTGNKSLTKSVLLENMAMEEVSWPEKLIFKHEPYLYSQELLAPDLDRVKRIYQSKGFLHVQVSLDRLNVNHKKQTVKVWIAIVEGEPVTAGNLSLDVPVETQPLHTDSLWQKISGKLEMKKGSRFSDTGLQKDVLFIEDVFKSMGYAYTSVDYHLTLKPEELQTDIQFRVNPGPLTYFGETRLSGNKHVTSRFLHKQLKYQEGKLYDQSLLNKTRQNFYNLQLFRIVSVLPERDPGSREQTIPVNIYLEEAPRVTSRFGAGYGTEDKFRTFLDVNLRGFPGGARRVNLYLKHSDLEPYAARLRWIQPLFLGSNSTISVNPFLVRNREPGYDTRTYGVNMPVTYQFNSSTTGKITYYLEDVKQFIEPGDAEFLNRESNKYLYSKSGVLLSAVFNNSSPVFSPEKGMNLSVGYKINGSVFGSDFNYSRLWADFRTYQKVIDVVFAFRLSAGGIHSADSSRFIPVEDRFYSGGSNSIRGWNRSELGPKRESGTPLGGKSFFESNAEIRYPIAGRFSLVAFFEAGNVWEKSYTYNLNQLGYSAGSGFRFETPIGPVRFDVGFPLWNKKKNPQFFISVGQAF